MAMVAEQISSTWNTRMIQQELRATIRNQAGTLFTLDNRATIREILAGNRPYGALSRILGSYPGYRFGTPPVLLFFVSPVRDHFLQDILLELTTGCFIPAFAGYVA